MHPDADIAFFDAISFPENLLMPGCEPMHVHQPDVEVDLSVFGAAMDMDMELESSADDSASQYQSPVLLLPEPTEGDAPVFVPTKAAQPLHRRRSAPVLPLRMPLEEDTPTRGARSYSLSKAEPKKSPVSPGGAKACVCCGISSTPMWREGRHNVRLCNACGIRWQKYGTSCLKCNYVPRKNERSIPCVRCNSSFPPPEATKRTIRGPQGFE